MAIIADDVSLEDIIPISLDFAVVEGELLQLLYLTASRLTRGEEEGQIMLGFMMCLLFLVKNCMLSSLKFPHTFYLAALLSVSSPEELAVVGELFSFPFQLSH